MPEKHNQEHDGEPQKTAKTAVDNDTTFYSYSSFAKRLGTCTATVRRMCARGELKRIIINSRLIRIPGSELTRLECGAQ
jgi:hypothetical protein